MSASRESQGGELSATQRGVQPANPQQSEYRWALGILLLFLGLGFWMSRTVPAFETPDEPFHYAFARHIAAGNGLPIQEPDIEQPWSHEGSQAPLYYLLTGLLTSSIDQSDYAEIAVRNPRANMGNPLLLGNKNFMLHSGDTRPLVGANLALHLGRWFSLLLASITLWFTWLIARLALPGSPQKQLLVILFTAVIPQFVFVSASFSNDNMVTATATVTVYLLARLTLQFTHQSNRIQHPWMWIVLGALSGLAALSKLSGLGVCLLIALVVWGRAIQLRQWMLPWRLLPLVAGPFVLVAGWWYWRNFSLYGDWLGANYLLEINGQRSDELTWAALWDEFRGLRYSFWGLFGWFNVPLPSWVYGIFDGLTVVAVAGLFCRGIAALLWPRSPTQSSDCNRTVLAILIVWALIPLGLITYWAQQATSSQGRLLFPALNALVILLVIGLDFWWRLLLRWLPKSIGPPEESLSEARPWMSKAYISNLGWWLLPGLPLACTLYALFFQIPQAYYAPLPISELPPGTEEIVIHYGDASMGQTEFTLLGLSIGDGRPAVHRYKPGEAVPISLYLQAEQQPTADHQLFIQLLDDSNETVANLTTHPGWGRNPTTLWKPGTIYADHYQVMIDGPVEGVIPLLAKVYVGIIDPSTEQSGRDPLPARLDNGEPTNSMPARIVISPTVEQFSSEVESIAKLEPPSTFEDHIVLSGMTLPSSVALSSSKSVVATLAWQALATPSTEYIAYVHLLDPQGNRVAGFDQPPTGRQLPTSYWLAGDRFTTEFKIDLPESLAPGAYQIWSGLYKANSQGGERLMVIDSGKFETAHNQLYLGEVTILQ